MRLHSFKHPLHRINATGSYAMGFFFRVGPPPPLFLVNGDTNTYSCIIVSPPKKLSVKLNQRQ